MRVVNVERKTELITLLSWAAFLMILGAGSCTEIMEWIFLKIMENNTVPAGMLISLLEVLNKGKPRIEMTISVVILGAARIGKSSFCIIS